MRARLRAVEGGLLDERIRASAAESQEVEKDVYTKEELHGLLEQARDDVETAVKEKMDKLTKELEVKQEKLNTLEAAKEVLRKEQEGAKELLQNGENMSEEKMQSLSTSIFNDVSKIIKKHKEENLNPEEEEEKRAFRQKWELLREVTILPNDKETPQHLRDQYKTRQSLLMHCPKRGKQTFTEWSKDVFGWAKDLLEVGTSMEQLGKRVTQDGLEGFRHEQRRARSIEDYDLVSIMLRLEEEACPLVKNVASDCYRLTPQLKRWKDMAPLTWVGVLEDVYEKEAEASGERDDSSKWEYSLQSLMLDKTTTQHLRTMYKPTKNNNFKMLATRLTTLNVTDTQRYLPDGKVYTEPPKKGRDPLEELRIAIGEHSVHAAGVTSTREISRTLKTVLGSGLFTAPSQGPMPGFFCPPVDELLDPQVYFGGGGAPSSPQTPSGWMTKEELKKLNETPCKFGKDCWNLKNKGKCLRKHTVSELKAGQAEFKKNFPEKAAQMEEERKKKAAEKKKAQENKESGNQTATENK
eukprot:g18388.t1